MKILFVTGKLAANALTETLAGMRADFEYEVATLRITVAALMTTAFIQRNLRPKGADLIMLPGLCRVDAAALAERFGTRVEKGPKDLRDIPYHFGVERKREGYGDYRLKILAEINDAPTLAWPAVLAQATAYRNAGADVIDVGCTPGQPAPKRAAEIVRGLKGEGFSVSIDTFDPDEIREADRAEADLLLSVNAQNLHLAPDLRCRVVVIPDSGEGLDSLARNVEALERKGVRGLILDPILAPITFGVAASLHRYYVCRQRFPEAEILMGIGNVTELTDADSTGITALLAGVMAELDIGYALTTEVANWCRGAVRELDRARRLMHYAKERRVLPKDVDDSLLTVKDRKTDYPSVEELRELHRMVTDPNFRIFVDGEAICLFNNRVFIRDTDPQAIFQKVGQVEASHAFYLGRELIKAAIALRLGKKYIQEEDLSWGYLSDGLPGH